MKRNITAPCLLLAVAAWLTGPLFVSGSTADVPDGIRNIVAGKCAVCHKGIFAPRGLKLEPDKILKNVLDIPSKGKPQIKLVDTAAPESSYILMKTTGAEGIKGKKMPPAGKPQLTDEEISLLRDWVLSLKAK
jgi:mono/diheme cytochrome c family protein